MGKSCGWCLPGMASAPWVRPIFIAVSGLGAGEVAQAEARVHRGHFLPQGRGEQEVAAGERNGSGLQQQRDVRGQRAGAELTAAPNRAGAAGGVVVAGQQEDRDFREIGKDAEGLVHQGVGDEVVLEKIARHEEGVHGAVAGMGERGAQGLQALGTQAFPFRAELGETCAELPVGGMDEAEHAGGSGKKALVSL